MAGIKRKSWWLIKIFHFYRTDNLQKLKKIHNCHIKSFPIFLTEHKIPVGFSDKMGSAADILEGDSPPPDSPLEKAGQ